MESNWKSSCHPLAALAAATVTSLSIMAAVLVAFDRAEAEGSIVAAKAACARGELSRCNDPRLAAAPAPRASAALSN